MDRSRIAALLAPFLTDVPLSDPHLTQLSTYLDLLLRWNARINLTAIRDPEQIVTRHFGESLFTARHLYSPGSKPEPGNWKPETGNPNWRLATGDWLLDLGSGAGFPGLPIKIWAPAVRVTLIESQHRKATFLREVIRALALSSIDVFPGRAEDFELATGDWRPATVTLRAVENFEKALLTAARLLTAAPTPTRRIALLIGAAQVPRARQLLPDLTWFDPILIPQSSNRVLLLGAAAGPFSPSASPGGRIAEPK